MSNKVNPDMFAAQGDSLRKNAAPLAARMRPEDLSEFVGQTHVVGEGHILRKVIESGQLPSMIIWGPPGSGKTTLAHIIANTTDSIFSSVSAVTAGVADLRRVIEEARNNWSLYGRKTILFIDEIHRFNKAQQDAVLPYVEDGTVTLIGATTENPSFEVITPLLSRSRVFVLKPLSEEELESIIERAVKDKDKGLGKMSVSIDSNAVKKLILLSNNDARTALNTLELAALTTMPDEKGKRVIDEEVIADVMQHRVSNYDKGGEQHYDLISAMHKSLRDSDPDATLYWMARMLEGGEDPMFIARRLVRAATEDIGMADPQALTIAMSAQQAVHFIGMPEGCLALAEAAVYLATAPKSNSIYSAYTKVSSEVKNGSNDPVPLHLRNAVTGMMKDMGYGKGYKYAHNYDGSVIKQQHLPDRLDGQKFYYPGQNGYENEITRRLADWAKKKDIG